MYIYTDCITYTLYTNEFQFEAIDLNKSPTFNKCVLDSFIRMKNRMKSISGAVTPTYEYIFGVIMALFSRRLFYIMLNTMQYRQKLYGKLDDGQNNPKRANGKR